MNPIRTWTARAVLTALPLAAGAAELHVWPDADLALGRQLMQQHDCAGCHAKKAGGDGSAIYRPGGRVDTPSALVSMVERCNTELNLGMFPDEVVSVAAVLQRDHYRFLRQPGQR